MTVEPRRGRHTQMQSFNQAWRNQMTFSRKCVARMRAFVKDESGLSAVEYGLLAAGIAIGLWTLIDGIGTDLGSIFSSVKGDLDKAKPAG
jgi:pilus assembly protein Flp/PilA